MTILFARLPTLSAFKCHSVAQVQEALSCCTQRSSIASILIRSFRYAAVGAERKKLRYSISKSHINRRWRKHSKKIYDVGVRSDSFILFDWISNKLWSATTLLRRNETDSRAKQSECKNPTRAECKASNRMNAQPMRAHTHTHAAEPNR